MANKVALPYFPFDPSLLNVVQYSGA